MNEPADKNGVTRPQRRSRIQRGVLRLALLVLIITTVALAWPRLQARTNLLRSAAAPTGPDNGSVASAGPSLTETPTSLPPTETDIPTPTQTQTAIPTSDLSEPPAALTVGNPDPEDGVWILALREGVDTHLFAFHPEYQPLTRLTTGPWQDISPAVSPDGSEIVFVSNRTGQWDLYSLNMLTGSVTRLSETPQYEGAPSWSPDGLWLAYESYELDNLDIYVRPVQGDQPPLPLTTDAGGDYSPAWSPRGRQIAFISTRGGGEHVWIANLDQAGEEGRRNLSAQLGNVNRHPAWSPDGRYLAWSTIRDGIRSLYIWDADAPYQMPRYVGGGDWPVWSPDGQTLLSSLETPAQTYLTAYDLANQGIVSVGALAMPAPVAGLSWMPDPLPNPLPEGLSAAQEVTPTPIWLLGLTPDPQIPAGRRGLVPLEDVTAPYPQLHDLVDEAFTSVRLRVAIESGWDFLANLENAFVPLTASLPPGMGEDWLYTGRAFSFSTVPINAGWMTVVRDDFGQQTFWRVFIRARFQDGTQGRPLPSLPWDFEARNSGVVQAYEAGGALAASIPSGYWVDVTAIALAYGWERLPALGNWRTYFPGTRMNEFAMTMGLDWADALLELYPPEVLITPTVIIPPTRTPSPTPRWYHTPTPTRTPTPRATLTPSPTPAN